MPEASQGRRVWDLSDEMIKERRWSFELALRRELDETASERSRNKSKKTKLFKLIMHLT